MTVAQPCPETEAATDPFAHIGRLCGELTNTVAAALNRRGALDVGDVEELIDSVTTAEQALHEALVCAVKGAAMDAPTLASAADSATGAKETLLHILEKMSG